MNSFELKFGLFEIRINVLS